jgi:parvulin-like peptidyl-prolyl isomerase
MRQTATLHRLLIGAAWLACTAASGAEQAPAPVLDVSNEVVCRVNTHSISKAHVEERMGAVAFRLYAMRRQLELNGQWNEDSRKKWDELYIEPFRDALRVVIRERLLLQNAIEAKVTVDEVYLSKRVRETVERLKADGLLNSRGFTIGEIQRRLREQALSDTFRAQHISNFLDNPSRPEVREYYEKNLARFQRNAGMKLRLIRVDRFVTNKLTGQTSLRADALEQAERLREDIVRYSADFKEVAKQHSDDPDSRERGGLLLLDPKDPYIDPETYNAQLARALRGLKKNDVTKVFELGQTSWAFAWIEDIREPGPAPLEGELYDEIYRTLLQQKNRKNEDAWFRKALSRALIVHVVSGKEIELPVEFFFPDEQPQPRPGASATTDAAQKPAQGN